MARERLIDGFGEGADAHSRHEIRIAAGTADVWSALWSADVAEIGLAKLLLGIRHLPAILTGKRRELRSKPRPTLLAMQDAGFGKLAESPEVEIVFGVTGRFWSPVGNIDPFELDAFERPVVAGRARALWNFVLVNEGDDATRLETETRVFCGDPSSRRKFRSYWLFVRPFSGLIRVVMLRQIRELAEARVG